uniref:Uncharacterized protein n=1 Tax=Pararge aegeria TaxID=116150 RepID=S4P3D9_9NEOP
MHNVPFDLENCIIECLKLFLSTNTRLWIVELKSYLVKCYIGFGDKYNLSLMYKIRLMTVCCLNILMSTLLVAKSAHYCK